MKFLPLRLLACALLAHIAHAQSPLTLTAPGALKTLGANWQSASALGGDPRHDKILTGLPGSGGHGSGRARAACGMNLAAAQAAKRRETLLRVRPALCAECIL